MRFIWRELRSCFPPAVNPLRSTMMAKPINEHLRLQVKNFFWVDHHGEADQTAEVRQVVAGSSFRIRIVVTAPSLFKARLPRSIPVQCPGTLPSPSPKPLPRSTRRTPPSAPVCPSRARSPWQALAPSSGETGWPGSRPHSLQTARPVSGRNGTSPPLFVSGAACWIVRVPDAVPW